jgi:thioester reductase-like protein
MEGLQAGRRPLQGNGSDLDEGEKRAIVRRVLEEQALVSVDSRHLHPPYATWISDLVLDKDIRVENPPHDVEEARACLITGATGYLGAFLLAELCRSTDMRLYCLVRAADSEQAEARIRSNLETFGLWDVIDTKRLIAIPGDLASPRIGLDPSTFRELARSLDTVFHLGAVVNFLFSYDDIRDANVLGVKELLRFASAERLKPVHFASTYGVFLTALYEQCVVSNAELPRQVPRGGYAESKWVAERLVHKARQRGFQISMYRPPFIGWDSRSGAYNPQDFVVRMIAGSLQLNMAPDLPLLLHVTPVNVVSEAMVALAHRRDSLGKNHNLVFAEGLRWRDMIHALAMNGSTIRTVGYDSWRRAVHWDSDNPMRPLMSVLPERLETAGRTYIDLLQESRVPAGFEGPNLDQWQSTSDAQISVNAYVRSLLSVLSAHPPGDKRSGVHEVVDKVTRFQRSLPTVPLSARSS